jgi:hypothetical protein
METPKITMPVTPPVESKPITMPVTPEVIPEVEKEITPELPTAPESEVKAFKDRTPCNWALTPSTEHSGIIARNIQNGETFEGSMADFNKLLRG